MTEWFSLDRRGIIVLASVLTVFVSFGIRSGFGVLLPKIIDALALTKTEAGYVGSSFFIGYIVSAPLLGILTDKIGARIVITAFCIVMGAGTLLMGTVSSLWTACLFNSIAGVGAANSWGPVVALLQKWFNVRQKGMVLGLLSVGAHFGMATMGMILPWLLFGHGWRFGWFALGFLALMIVPINGVLLRSRPEDESIKIQSGLSSMRAPANLGMSVSQIDCGGPLKNSNFWLIGISYLALSFAINSAFTFLVTYATVEVKIGYTVAAMLVTILALSGIPGSLILPLFSNRLGRMRVLTVSNLILAGSLSSFVLGKPGASSLMLSALVFGIFSGGLWPLYGACATDFFSPSVAGTVMGFWSSLFGLGSMVSPLITGYIADIYGSFFWSFIVSSLLSVVAALFVLSVEEPRQARL